MVQKRSNIPSLRKKQTDPDLNLLFWVFRMRRVDQSLINWHQICESNLKNKTHTNPQCFLLFAVSSINNSVAPTGASLSSTAENRPVTVLCNSTIIIVNNNREVVCLLLLQIQLQPGNLCLSLGLSIFHVVQHDSGSFSITFVNVEPSLNFRMFAMASFLIQALEENKQSYQSHTKHVFRKVPKPTFTVQRQDSYWDLPFKTW